MTRVIGVLSMTCIVDGTHYCCGRSAEMHKSCRAKFFLIFLKKTIDKMNSACYNAVNR